MQTPLLLSYINMFKLNNTFLDILHFKQLNFHVLKPCENVYIVVDVIQILMFVYVSFDLA